MSHDAGVTQASLTVAVITASVAVLVAVLAQISTWSLEHRNRVYERRRAALHDVQDAALAVRSSLRLIAAAVRDRTAEVPPGGEVAPTEDPRITAAREDAAAVLALRLARVESMPVRESVRRWHEMARYSFLGDDAASDPDTEVAWNAMNELIGEQLTVPGWWRRRTAKRA